MSGVLTMQWADRNLSKYGKRILTLKTKFPKVLPRIVNQVGDRSKTIVIRELTKQTGLQRAVIVRAIGDPRRASSGRYVYDMTTRGGNIRLKYLKPRETRKGVVARPFGKSTLFAGAFLRGGRFPNRKEVSKFDGHAFVRVNRSGSRITFARSGVYIPVEMTSGATVAAFHRVAAPLLDQRVSAVLDKLVP